MTINLKWYNVEFRYHKIYIFDSHLFTGKMGGLYPEGNRVQQALIDEILAACEDTMGLLAPSFPVKDADKKKAMRLALMEPGKFPYWYDTDPMIPCKITMSPNVRWNTVKSHFQCFVSLQVPKVREPIHGKRGSWM